MTIRKFPPYPALPSLRLADTADITRMAEVSVLGFQDSEIFRYERPGYDAFPGDAVVSFGNIYRSQLSDPQAVVIVAEDWWRESEETDSVTEQGQPRRGQALAERVVVGVGSWVFPNGSPRAGQFVVRGVGAPEDGLDRDLCRRRLDMFNRAKEAADKKYLAGTTICDKLVVHPRYRRRGHATAMLRWGQHLCAMDGVDTGVIPAHMGERIYVSVGYEVIGEMRVPDDGEVEGFTQRVAVYRASDVPGGESADIVSALFPTDQRLRRQLFSRRCRSPLAIAGHGHSGPTRPGPVHDGCP